jgi:hypothetical protein
LGRIIRTESAGKDRKWIERSIVAAIRELAAQEELSEQTYDLVAYIAISLEAISNTIDESVAAWEKRGYWLKADRFRLEWSWTEKAGEELRKSLASEDWGNVARITAQISQKLGHIKLPQRNRIGTPWVGVWQKLKRPDHHH